MGYSPWGRKELVIIEVTQHTHTHTHTDNKLGLWGNASGMMIENRVGTRPALSGDCPLAQERSGREEGDVGRGTEGELPRKMAAHGGGGSHD